MAREVKDLKAAAGTVHARALSESLRSSFLTLLEADHAVRKVPLVTIRKQLEAFPWVVKMPTGQGS